MIVYHLNILKGGFLAVCTFFVMSGYLSVITCFKKEKLSLKDYYLNKLKKIYLPLLVVTFLSILEMTKNKEIILRQENNFSDIYLERVDKHE